MEYEGGRVNKEEYKESFTMQQIREREYLTSSKRRRILKKKKKKEAGC